MDPAQIASLLDPFLTHPLPPHELSQISTYIDLLLRWNSRTNLTAIRTPEDIVTRHFGESLFAAQTLFPRLQEPDTEWVAHTSEPAPVRPPSAHPNPGPEGTSENSPAFQRRVPPAPTTRPVEPALSLSKGTPEAWPQPSTLLDLGSGPGFPGLPIHLATPHLHTTLLESNQKKVAFLREVIRALTLTNINVSPARAEDFPYPAQTVTLRAVERFDQILPTAARLVAAQGRLALLIGEPQLPRAQAALPDFTWQPPIQIPNSTARILLIGTPTQM